MELRGFQLLGNLEALERYTKAYTTVNKDLDSLLPILLSKVNQERIIRLKNDFNAWHASNEKRLEIIKKYGKIVNSELFEKEHKAEFDILNASTQKGATAFLDISKQIDELNEGVKNANFKRLSTNEMLSEVVLGLVSLFVLVFFYFISTSIKNSVSKAKSGCEQIRQTKDLHTRIETGSHDEINDTMQAVNTLLADIEDAMKQAKINAHENASVAEELSSTSLQIGKRAEEEATIVTQTTHSANEVSKEMNRVSAESIEVQNVITQAQQSLMKAQNFLAETMQHLSLSAEAEVQINDRLNHLASEAQQVRTVLDVIGEMNVNVQRIHELSNFSHQVTTQTDEAVGMLEKSVHATQKVVISVKENATMIDKEVIQKVESIHTLSSSNARSVQEIAAAAEHLSRLAGTLSNTLSQFKTA